VWKVINHIQILYLLIMYSYTLENIWCILNLKIQLIHEYLLNNEIKINTINGSCTIK